MQKQAQVIRCPEDRLKKGELLVVNSCGTDTLSDIERIDRRHAQCEGDALTKRSEEVVENKGRRQETGVPGPAGAGRSQKTEGRTKAEARSE